MVLEGPGHADEFDPTAIFRTIVVPVDLTPDSRTALITACDLCKQLGGDLRAFLLRRPGDHSRAAVEFDANRGVRRWVESAARCRRSTPPGRAGLRGSRHPTGHSTAQRQRGCSA